MEDSTPAYLKIYKDLKPIVLEQDMKSSDPFAIHFVEVVEDSRCPKDVHCFQIGSATVKIALSKEDTHETVNLSIPGKAEFGKPDFKIPWDFLPSAPTKLNTKEFQGKILYFVDLNPYPEAENTSREAKKYRATFFIKNK